MLGRDDDITAPRPATLIESPDRVTELAFALSDPERTALLATLVASAEPGTAETLAGQTRLDTERAREHLRILVSAGLAATKRTGLKRIRTYAPTITDLELRFFGGDKPSRERGRTHRILERDAKRRERQKRKLAKKERRLARERRKA